MSIAGKCATDQSLGMDRAGSPSEPLLTELPPLSEHATYQSLVRSTSALSFDVSFSGGQSRRRKADAAAYLFKYICLAQVGMAFNGVHASHK